MGTYNLVEVSRKKKRYIEIWLGSINVRSSFLSFFQLTNALQFDEVLRKVVALLTPVYLIQYKGDWSSHQECQESCQCQHGRPASQAV
jgi:hypothetical protein